MCLEKFISYAQQLFIHFHRFLSNVLSFYFLHVHTVGLGFAELIEKFRYHSALGKLVKTGEQTAACCPYLLVIILLLIYTIRCVVNQYLDFGHFNWKCVLIGVFSSLFLLVFQVYSLVARGLFQRFFHKGLKI